VWERASGSGWARRLVVSGDVELASVSCTLDVGAVYHDELGQILIASKREEGTVAPPT
jgi:hypothetical protein